MTRTLPTAYRDGLSSNPVYLVFLADFDFDGDPAYLWTGAPPLTWDAKDYIGVAGGKVVAGISPVEESLDGRATGMKFTLSGFDGDLLPLALAGDYQGREFRLYMALFSPQLAMISEPQIVMVGEMDQMQVTDGAAPSITLIGETYAAEDDEANEVRYTAEEQERLYPGDKGLEFINAMVDASFVWGTPNDVGSSGPVQTEHTRSFDR